MLSSGRAHIFARNMKRKEKHTKKRDETKRDDVQVLRTQALCAIKVRVKEIEIAQKKLQQQERAAKKGRKNIRRVYRTRYGKHTKQPGDKEATARRCDEATYNRHTLRIHSSP
jgi:hypothetical protein